MKTLPLAIPCRTSTGTDSDTGTDIGVLVDFCCMSERLYCGQYRVYFDIIFNASDYILYSGRFSICHSIDSEALKLKTEVISCEAPGCVPPRLYLTTSFVINFSVQVFVQ